MYLSKRSNGIYHLYYEKSDGKITSISTKTSKKSDALKFLNTFQKEQKTKEQFPKITLKDFSFKFLMFSETAHTAKTQKVFKTTFNFLLSYFGNINISELTTKRINEYLEHRRKTASLFQARKDLINISSALNKAVLEKYMAENPCKGIKRIKTPEKQPLYFTKDDFNKLLEKIDCQDIKQLVIFALNTGLRQTELLTLTWNQIDFERRFLILDNRKHITKGKKVRTIPLNEISYNILAERLRDAITDCIFTYSGVPIKQDFIVHRFKKYIREAKLNDKLNFHSLRHTFATWLVQNGADINRISKLLGHADIKTTEIYAHLLPEDLRNTVSLLDN